MKTYSVKPAWRKRGIRVKAKGPFFAIEKASDIDPQLTAYTWSVGMGSQKFPWGMRYERAQVCVDVVETHK